ADLAGYRAALSGRATADDARPSDPPSPVHFRDLWERREAYQGRRVTVRSRVARVFRQGPIGSFPHLAQARSFSPSGDQFCTASPLPGGSGVIGHAPVAAQAAGKSPGGPSPAVPDLGREVRFTGTFLKMVRYAAADGARLAPLIVGD